MAGPNRRNGRFLLMLAAGLWAGAMAGGFWLLYAYAASPGQGGDLPLSWPAKASLQPAPERATLLVFAHPRCPCTRATIGELALLMTRCQGQIETRVLFYKPSGSTAAWEQTDLWRAAEQIPGVQVSADLDGVQARQFSAKTSGHALLYSPSGQLLFSGGITPSRGHAGDNTGRSAIVALVTGSIPEATATGVFGCPLCAAESNAR